VLKEKKWKRFLIKVFTEGKKVVGQAFFFKERLLVKLFYTPLQGLRVSPSWACGGTGGARDGAEPHIRKGLC